MIYGLRDQAVYTRVIETAERALDLYVEAHGYEPSAIYATPDMLKVLDMGSHLIYSPDQRQPKLFGIDVSVCAGPGMQFHFAEKVFIIEGEVRP